MFNFFSPENPSVPKVFNRKNLEEQMAQIRMQDIYSYRVYFILPNLSNTINFLILISNALGTPAIQNNRDHLDALYQYLIKIDENITYYKSPSSNGIFKWLFWSAPESELNAVRDHTRGYIERILNFQKNISPASSLGYQQADRLMGNNIV